MAEPLGEEQAVHGQPWGRLHGGYFSDPTAVKSLVEAVRAAWVESRPDVIVDLGGGTGFLLSQVRKVGIGVETALVNLDCSTAQLEVAKEMGISSICGLVNTFRRNEVISSGSKALFLMRSVLHYFGEQGLGPLLRHLRAQAEEGEIWVHQTACFERENDAACLNALYRRMHTNKWYPTVDDLRGRLVAAGWRVEDSLPAPLLHLDSAELGVRYGLNEAKLQHIRKEMAAEWGGPKQVFRVNPAGFEADLHYRIFACRAAL